MKTLTITLHDTDNCGSSLQAFALQHFLLKNNIDNEIINYVPKYVTNNGTVIKTFLRKIIFFKDSLTREMKFKKFKKEYLKITEKKYTKYEQLEKENFLCDCIITGSDQLWNSRYKCGQDPAFYLDFVKDKNISKISYAVSLGREKVPSENIEIIKNYVNNFKWISVRESSSINQIKKVLPKLKMDYVCDPVLLHESEVYKDIKSSRLIKEKYILIYMAQIPNTKFIDDFIDKIKKEKGTKIVLIGSYRNRCKCDIHIRDVAPKDFLSLIYNAEYIVSNSFHATMFSLIFEKEFASILPPENGARIKEILNYVGLKENGIEYNDEKVTVPYVKDYNKVRKELGKFRDFSSRKLLENLQIIENESKNQNIY